MLATFIGQVLFSLVVVLHRKNINYSSGYAPLTIESYWIRHYLKVETLTYRPSLQCSLNNYSLRKFSLLLKKYIFSYMFPTF